MDDPPAAPGATPPTPQSEPAKPADKPASKPAAKAEIPEATLLTKDGEQFSGFLILRDEKNIVLRIAGIDTTFEVANVEVVTVLPSIAERYRDLRLAIDDNDVEQLTRIIDWLVVREQFDAARREADLMVMRMPDNPVAARNRERILNQIELAESARRDVAAREAAPAHATPKPGAPAADPKQPANDPIPLLSPEQINLLKVFEMDLNNPPRIDIPRDVITKLLEQYAGHPLVPTTKEGRDALYRKMPREQLDLIFKLRAREFYPRVKVLDPPEALRIFRDDVNRQWLTNSCATTACHGGTEAGRLMLTNKRSSNEASFITNFYILDHYRMADGTPLIDYAVPEKSALLQLTLPRNLSAVRHPAVLRGDGTGDQWKPVFLKADDKRLARAAEWIKQMYRPRAEYPIEYTPARPFVVAKPAEQPQGR